LAEPAETWSERFEREFEAVFRLLRRRPVLAIVFLLAMAFLGWHQFIKPPSKEDTRLTFASPAASVAGAASAMSGVSAGTKPKKNRYRLSANGGGIDDELFLNNVTENNSEIVHLKFGIIPDYDFYAYKGDVLRIVAIDLSPRRCYGFAKALTLQNVDTGEIQKLSDPILNCDKTRQKTPYEYLNTIGPIVI
jgi:hypothetical protein